MAAAKGRGFAIQSQIQELRRPGETYLKQQSSSVTENEKLEDTERKISEVCNAMSQINLADSTEKLKSFTQLVSSVCKTSEDLEKCAAIIFDFAVKSKWNAHLTAIFCNYLGDITAGAIKFRTVLLRKLQTSYKDRNKMYLELEKFLLDAAFLCEIFHHMHIDGCCLKVLAHPIIDYFGMLVDGASYKEIELFIEHFPKCFKNLKENDPSGLDVLMTKLRKQIVCETSTVTVKAMLLEIFELVLTDWKPMDQSAKVLYESLSKPIVRICD